MQLIERLASNVTLSWDPRALELQFVATHVNAEGEEAPWHHPLGFPHWQKYATGIQFARNLFHTFPHEMKAALEVVEALQATAMARNALDPDSLRARFGRAPMEPNRIGLIKIDAGVSVRPHTDITRDLALNIGLRNSDSHSTVMWETGNIRLIDSVPYHTFCMNDGDAYLLSVDHVHEVTDLGKSDEPRYILTYTMGGSSE